MEEGGSTRGELVQLKVFKSNASLGIHYINGARCSSMVRAFAHGAMDRWIDPSWGEPIELFLIPASAPRLWYVLSCI